MIRFQANGFFSIFTGSDGCPIVCKGRYIIKNELYNRVHCVGYNITFRLNSTNLSTLRDFPCEIPKCVLDVLKFECMFSANTTNTTHLEPIKTTSTEVLREKSDTCTGTWTITILQYFTFMLGRNVTFTSTHLLYIFRRSYNCYCQCQLCCSGNCPWNGWFCYC